MHMGEEICETYSSPPVTPRPRLLVRAIRLRGGDTIAYEEHVNVPVRVAALQAGARDVLKAFVFERHHASGTHAAGFVCGLGITRRPRTDGGP